MRQGRGASHMATARMTGAVCAVLAAGAAHAQSPLPDPVQTPGALNPAVTQGTIDSTICVKGWTKSIRPPQEFTSSLKRRQISEQDSSNQRMRDYEEDHLIPLEQGGAPADPQNLWPQPRITETGWTAGRKDELESRLNRLVCTGELPLAEAQRVIATDWTSAYSRFIGEALPLRAASATPPPRLLASGPSCPADVVVWVNTSSGVYHYSGQRWYGNTSHGEFECEKAAIQEGDRASHIGQ